MNRSLLVLTAAALVALPASAANYVLHSFKKIQLTPHFWAEGANFGDFNHDGKMDVVYGPFWWAGPEFQQRHEYAPAANTFKRKKSDGVEEIIPGYEGALGVNNAYAPNFFAFTYDFNGDGWTDIFIIGLPGEPCHWYENPKGAEGHWPKHVAFDVTDNESPTFTDLVGDGKPELVCGAGGYLGYATPDWADPAKPWKYHRLSPKGQWHKYSHGLGVGDINGDGRLDYLDKDGWWEQPASLAGDPVWTCHPFEFSKDGAAQMYAYDLDGDGDNDVITALACHGYGLAWYEQVKENGQITFKPHVIMGKDAADNKYGVHFSQPHAIDLVDMDGDGVKDIVVGKRFWAHGPQGDVEPNAAAVLYWFKLVRGPNRAVDLIPYLVDNDSGVGTQVVAGDLNGDGLPDIVVGNKKGGFVFLHQTREVSRAEWEQAQPKPYSAGAAPKP